MKKRIICLILAIVMLSLSLVGCAYSYENERLEKYVEEFDAKKFETALKNLAIEDGAFSEADPEKREHMVMDAIYALLLKNATDTAAKNEGKPGAHDKFAYSYYITMEVDVKDEDGKKIGTKTVQLAPEYMTTAGKANLQLGMNIYDSTLQEKINELAKDYEFKTDKVYNKVTLSSNKAEKGQLVALSYKYSYTPEGKDKAETDSVAYQIVTLDENNPLHKALIGYSINTEYKTTVKDKDGKDTTVKTITVPAGSKFVINGKEVNEEITLSEVKINYVIKGELFAEIEDVTYDEEPSTAMKDIYGDEQKVKDANLTYHVYAYRYYAVDELNATNVIKLLYGKNLTEDVLKELIEFGAELKDKSEEDQEKYFENFKVSDFEADKDSTVYDTLAAKLVTALKDYDTKKSTLSTAETALNKATDTYNDAKSEYDKNPDSDAAKDEYESALKEKESKEKSLAEAQTALTEAENTRDELIAALITRDYKAIKDAKKAYEDAEKAEADAKDKYEKAKKDVDEANKENKYETAKKDQEAKETALKKAKEDEAKKKTEAEKEGATQAAKDAYTAAQAATKKADDELTAAKKAASDAKAALDAAQAQTKDEKEAWEAAKKATEAAYDKYKNPEILEEEDAIFVEGYKDLQYKELQEEYRAEIEEKVAVAVFKLIVDSVKLKDSKGYPKKAVDEAYDMLMNAYKYEFYNGNYTVNGKVQKDENNNNITNYSHYRNKGGFKGYLVEQVKVDYPSVEDYGDAKDAVRAMAQDQVAPVVKYSYIAQYYDWKWDLVFEDWEFKDYKKDKDNGYESDEYTFGETAVRNGLQFEKIMDFFTDKKEVVDENDPEGKFIRDEYKNVRIVLTEKK